MNRFEQILKSGKTDENLGFQAMKTNAGQANQIPGNQEKYWQAVLTNAYFLRYPAGEGKFEPLRPLYDVLENLNHLGAGLARVEETVGRSRIVRLKLEQGSIPDQQWQEIRASHLPRFKDQLRWLFTLSAMGAAMDYVDLAADFPKEWVGDVLGKYGARIAELRVAVIEEILEKDRRSGLYFKTEDGRVYCMVPCKTGRRGVTELTPEEAVLVAEAQDTGMLPPGPEGALSALKWAG